MTRVYLVSYHQPGEDDGDPSPNVSRVKATSAEHAALIAEDRWAFRGECDRVLTGVEPERSRPWRR